MEMNREQAFRTVAKHIYIAYPTYSTSRTEIVVLADSEGEARMLASGYFQRSLIMVKPVEATKNAQIYEI